MITTYDSNCLKCLNGMIHPWHDNGTPAETLEKDSRFSQLPPEPDERRCVCSKCADVPRVHHGTPEPV